MGKRFQTRKDFYPYYLNEHPDPTCRVLHFIGTDLLFIILFASIWLSNYWLLISIPIVGYGFAWVGHYFFEKKSATFQYPFFSLSSYFLMFFDLITGKEKFRPVLKILEQMK